MRTPRIIRKLALFSETMALEDLEKGLYQEEAQKEKNPPPKDFAKTETSKSFAKTAWPEEASKAVKKTFGWPGFLANFSQMGRRFFWISIVAVLILIPLGAFYFYQYFTARDIVFTLKAPDNILIGVPFNIEVSVQNNFNNPLKDVRLSMILPEGTAFVGDNSDKRTFNESFGDLDKNGALQENIQVIIFGNEQSVKKFEVAASYFPPTLGPKARFSQTKSVEVSARTPGIKLDLTSPQKVLNNEEFELEVDYQNVSNIDFSGVELKLDYPDFFTFKSATVKPSIGDNVWTIGDLVRASSKGSLIIKGKVLTAEKTFFEIKGLLSANFSGRKYLISEKTADLNIASSPLSLSITLNDKTNYLAFLDSDLRYKITYRNNSEVGLNDVIIKAKLAGEMFDFSRFRGNAFFDSKDNTVTWNVANTPELRVIAPGSEGFVEFEINTKESYPIKRVSDKNFTLKVAAEISSPTVPYYVASDKTVGLADFETKVTGATVINSQAFFRDSASGIINKGSLPPRVNVPTNFTVHWQITNYSTDAKNVEIRAYLQSGVRWTNQVKSNISSAPTYNERTQEVIWLIDKIPATKGVIDDPVEAIFQVEATPNIAQVGQGLPLLSNAILKAVDDFVNTDLTSSALGLNTQLISDPNFDQTTALVIQ